MTEEIIRIPLADIEVDAKWNSRGARWMKESEGGPEEYEDGSPVLTGTNGLKDTIKEKGQDTPVDVMANPVAGGKPWFLVAGFRRYEAVRRLCEEWVKEGKGELITSTILARVRTLSPFEARELNMRENVVREKISPADLAWGIHQMVLAAQTEGRKLTQTQVAKSLSITPSYAGILMNVMARTEPKITQNWRDSLMPLSLSEMTEVSLKPPSEQEDHYKDLVKSRIEVPKMTGKAWTIHARKSAQVVGDRFGTLEANGYLKMVIKGGEPVLFSEHSIRAVVKVKSGKLPVSPRQLRGIAETACAAYKAAIARVEKEDFDG